MGIMVCFRKDYIKVTQRVRVRLRKEYTRSQENLCLLVSVTPQESHMKELTKYVKNMLSKK